MDQILSFFKNALVHIALEDHLVTFNFILHTASNMNKSTLRHSQCFQCREQNQPTVSVYASQQCL